MPQGPRQKPEERVKYREMPTDSLPAITNVGLSGGCVGNHDQCRVQLPGQSPSLAHGAHRLTDRRCLDTIIPIEESDLSFRALS